MLIKQISVFIENKPGRLSAVISALSEKNIDISALSLADTSEYGIIRMIVNQPELAAQTLKDTGVIVKITNVLAVSIDDTPGGLSRVLKVFVENGVTVDYMYAFVGTVSKKALMVVKVPNPDAAAKALDSANVNLVDAKDIYRF